MRKLLYFLLALICGCNAAIAQADVNRTLPVGNNPTNTATYNKQSTRDANLTAVLNLRIPVGPTYSIKNAKDSLGYVMYNSTLNRFGVYKGSGIWDIYISLADTASTIATQYYVSTHAPPNTFNADIVNNTAVTIGSVPVGGTLASNGKTAQQVITAIFTQTIHPNYNIPSASISGSPSAGNYERGTALSITLSSGFTQNDGGALTGTIYKNGATTITSPYSVTLTGSLTLSVQKTYNTGVCKVNNLGVLDCQVGSGNAPNPAPVASGTVTASMGYGIFDKGYAGYDANALVSGVPTRADILAATYTDNSGGSTFGTIVTPQQGSDKYFFVITTTPRTHVTVNNTPSDAAFNFNIPITFTNGTGNATFSGYAQVSKFPGGSTAPVTYVFN